MSGPQRERPCSARSARITGWGSYATGGVLTNADLEHARGHLRRVDPVRTGIRERRVAAARETTATLAAVAGRARARRRRPRPGRDRPDPRRDPHARLLDAHRPPRSSRRRSEHPGRGHGRRGGLLGVGLRPTPARTPTSPPAWPATCSWSAPSAVSRFLDYTDRNTCVLFGDGAGAVVLSGVPEAGGGLHGFELTIDPSGAYKIWIPAGGQRTP